MEHASTIDIGARKERQNGINEDSIATAVFENHHRRSNRPVGVFVLCDGVGGEASGDVASFLAATVIRKRLTDALVGPGTDLLERFELDAFEGTPPTATDSDDEEDDERSVSILTEEGVRAAVEDAINAAHRRVQQYAGEIDGRPATTAVVCVYFDGRLHYGWVGDSRAYLVNAEHRTIQQLTEDHAATNRLLEAGEIDDELYARVHRDATAITNAIGGSAYGEPTVDVDFESVELFRDDVLLITSDGLVDAYPDIASLRRKYERASDMESVRKEIRDVLVTDDEIRNVLLGATDLRDGVEKLVRLANDRGGKDNLSVTLARDPGADPSPDVLPARGVESRPPESLTARQTVVEPSGGVDPSGRANHAVEASAENELTEESGEDKTDEQSTDDESVEDPAKDRSTSDSATGPAGESEDGDSVTETETATDAETGYSEGDSWSADAETPEPTEADRSDSHDLATERSDGADKINRDADEEVDETDVEESDGTDPENPGEIDAEEIERGTDRDERPTAALVIAGHNNVYELEDGFTIGRGDVERSENPNVGLVVDETADIETHHARFEHEDGNWRVRDISTSGTFVEGEDGDWRYLLSDAGVERSRERGFDPEAVGEDVPNEAYQLRDGTAITLHHPHDRQSVTLEFFGSAERAERRTSNSSENNAGGR